MIGLSGRRVEVVAFVLVVIAVIVAPLSGSRLFVYYFTVTALYASVVIALNLLLGLAGQVSFAQTTFMAIGGYGSALMTVRLGWNPWLAMMLAMLLAALAALIIGRPLLQLRGHYLSMATFALALGTYSFVTAAMALTNGGIGISGIPPLEIGDISFAEPGMFYILAWILCGFTLAGYALLADSHIGRAWRALATGQDIAATLGIDVPGYKLLAFVLAAVIASIAGSFYVEFTSFVGPDLYDINIILSLFFMLFVGGRGSTIGPVVGAGVVVIVPQLMSGLERYQNLIFFVILLLLLLIRPAGLFGRVRESVPLSAILPGWLRASRRAGAA
jgi:branched-chain amino acid transport system permease protein